MYKHNDMSVFLDQLFISITHLPDFWSRSSRIHVVPDRKLFLNFRKAVVNTSGLRTVSGRKFWNVHNFLDDNFLDCVRKQFLNCLNSTKFTPNLKNEQGLRFAIFYMVYQVVLPMRELRKVLLLANYSWISRALSH